jgi:hypothetical protein
MSGPKKAAAKSSARKARDRSTVRSVIVHPADVMRSETGEDGKRRGVGGRPKLWARGLKALALDAGVSINVVRDAVQQGLDPNDIVSTTAWVCERQQQHDLAAGLRALARRSAPTTDLTSGI